MFLLSYQSKIDYFHITDAHQSVLFILYNSNLLMKQLWIFIIVSICCPLLLKLIKQNKKIGVLCFLQLSFSLSSVLKVLRQNYGPISSCALLFIYKHWCFLIITYKQDWAKCTKLGGMLQERTFKILNRIRAMWRIHRFSLAFSDFVSCDV